MIDYEVKIFNSVHGAAASLCAKNRFVSTPVTDLTAFPTAAVYELDNSTIRDRQSSTPTENFALLVYQADVYAQTKKEARKVFGAIDQRMIQLNFERIIGQFVPLPESTNLVRYTARYEAEIDGNGNLYRRKT